MAVSLQNFPRFLATKRQSLEAEANAIRKKGDYWAQVRFSDSSDLIALYVKDPRGGPLAAKGRLHLVRTMVLPIRTDHSSDDNKGYLMQRKLLSIKQWILLKKIDKAQIDLNNSLNGLQQLDGNISLSQDSETGSDLFNPNNSSGVMSKLKKISECVKVPTSYKIAVFECQIYDIQV